MNDKNNMRQEKIYILKRQRKGSHNDKFPDVHALRREVWDKLGEGLFKIQYS
jgi:hypothetical protein